MYKIILIPLLFSISAYSQKPEWGEVKVDSNFACRGILLFNSESLDSIYGLTNLCSSKNLIEIRVGIEYMPSITFDIVVFSYDGKWTATRNHAQLPDLLYGDKDKSKIERLQLYSEYGLDSIFNLLKANNIFSLGNQSDIKPNGLVDDGAYYYITFKVGDKYGGYSFNNPSYYVKAYKDIPQFKNYAIIQEVLEKLLKKK